MSKLVNSLGIDLGAKCTGVAVAQFYQVDNQTKYNLSPLAVIKVDNRKQLIVELTILITTWDIKQVVIGVLPPRLDGNRRRITIMAEKLARQITGLMHIPCFFEDESYSSTYLEGRGKFSKSLPKEIDSHSAAIILGSFFRKNNASSSLSL